MKKELGNERIINVHSQVFFVSASPQQDNNNSYDSQAHVPTSPGGEISSMVAPMSQLHVLLQPAFPFPHGQSW